MAADHEPAVEGPEHAAKVEAACWGELAADGAWVTSADGGGRATLTLAPESWTAWSGTASRT